MTELIVWAAVGWFAMARITRRGLLLAGRADATSIRPMGDPMLATKYIRRPDGTYNVLAPVEIGEDPDRMQAQAVEAISVLNALNIAACGTPDGPFAVLAVFNEEAW